MSERPTIISKATLLKAGGIGAAALGFLALRKLLTVEENVTSWPTDQEEILSKIESLNFPEGSHLRSTFLFRKILWEEAQRMKMEGTWTGNDESDWLRHIDLINEILSILSESGISGGRLVVFSFELTKNGKDYDFAPMETAIDLMHKNNLTVDLCIGPLDWPYDPGIRLPQEFEGKIREQVSKSSSNNIHISLNQDSNFPELSSQIRDFALDYVVKQLQLYGNDPRIDKIYISNEWPDKHGIEGGNGATMTVGQDFMLEVTEKVKSLTNKKIALNTNIHVSNLEKIKRVFKPFYETLGEQFVLGVDAYPTQEQKNFLLSPEIPNYDQHINALRQTFPKADIVFTELEGQPWPKTGVAGKSWTDIMEKHFNDEVVAYSQGIFPPTTESYIKASQIPEVGLWGVEYWLISEKMGYDFPLKTISTLASVMNK